VNTADVLSPLLGRPIAPGSQWATELGVASFPYFSDHRLQGLIVLPGSAYLEMAMAAITAVQGHAPSTIEDVVFERAFIVPPDGTRQLRIVLSPDSGRGWEFAASSADGRIRHARARLPGAGPPAGPATDLLHPEDPEWQNGTHLDGAELYRKLSAMGNEFGPAYRRIERCRVGDGAVVCWMNSTAKPNPVRPGQFFDPTIIDTAMQALTAATSVAGHTFALDGFERLTLHRSADADRVYGRMRPGRNDAGELVGDAVVVDDRGRTILEVAGVRLRCLPLPEHSTPTPALTASTRAGMTIKVAATFTGEPLEDALSFWFETLAVPAAIEFAPYGQLFQQFLDPAGLFAANVSGANVVLVRAEDLARPRAMATPRGLANPYTLPGNRPRFTVPGVGEIAHLARYETEFLHDEIFRREAYLRHGIELDDGACVFDLGANIGMFTLFVHSRCADAKIYAFEPCPPVFDLLRANTAAHVPQAVLFDCGVAGANAELPFTYYPRSPAFSGFAADPARDRAVVEAVASNVLRTQLPDRLLDLDPLVRHLTRERLESETYRCRTRTLSSVFTEYGIDRVDLLKIDTEGSEIGVLAGIRDEHWPLIRQIVAEVHSSTDAETVQELLRQRGFDVVADTSSELLRDTGFVQIFARRRDGAGATKPEHTWTQALERNAGELINVLRTSQNAARVPCIVALCPRSAVAARNDSANRALDRVEKHLADGLAAIANVHVITPTHLQETYPVADYADARADEVGRIPYTRRFYAALATMIARRYMALRRPPIKVIALDCDNTLWSGVCGEDGPAGVCIGPAQRALQEFIVRQRNSGMLVCLCSKNHPDDVHEVFALHPNLPLQPSHVVASRLNWNRKSANLASLAEELRLGLDCFVLIDDDEVECAEVRANCPEVLTLCLPADEKKASFLVHVWAFDRVSVTDEDRIRADHYRSEQQRHALHDKAMTFASFIAGLELRMTMTPCSRADWARIAQLTARTNQFNTTTIRRTEAQLHELLMSGSFECWTARVEDRFGDYGLVGAVLFRREGVTLDVDSFILSCRALGRGVEHRMLATLGGIAKERGLNSIAVSFTPSGRNEPARRFLVGVAQRTPTNNAGQRFTIATDIAAALVFEPAAATSKRETVALAGSTEPALTAALGPASPLYQRIATDLADVDSIVTAVERRRLRRRPASRSVFVGANDDLERTLASVWQQVLGIDEIGVNDNFFDAGGTSLLAVQLIAELARRFGFAAPPTTLFESTTIRALAAMMRSTGGTIGASGQRRGQRRREVGHASRLNVRRSR
jgi:FkbH-like protein/FkbM family methyltransferase